MLVFMPSIVSDVVMQPYLPNCFVNFTQFFQSVLLVQKHLVHCWLAT